MFTSTASNLAPAEFDELLTRLTEELATTELSSSDMALIPDDVSDDAPEARPPVESTHELAARSTEAAKAEAGSETDEAGDEARGIAPRLEIAGSVIKSLTIVAVVALVVLGRPQTPDAIASGAHAAHDDACDGAQLIRRSASERADDRARLMARTEQREQALRDEAAHLQAELEATKKVAKKVARKATRERSSMHLGTDFAAL